MEIRGPNVLAFQLVSGATRWYIIRCYIPPNNQTTLTHAKHTWQACPKRCLPIMIRDLNINLAAPRNKRDETIAKLVDTMALVDIMSSHFHQRRGKISQGRWTWRMRRGRHWISSWCDYVLGRATNLGQWCWRISVQMPFCHNSDHCTLVAENRAAEGGRQRGTKRHIGVSLLGSPRDPVQS